MKREFPIMSLLLIPIGVALNFVIGSIVKTLNLPIFLDSIGTAIAAILGGPIVGGITGFLGVLSISGFAPSAAIWSVQAAVIGLTMGLLARFGWFKGIKHIIVSTLIIIFLSVGLSATISYLVFNGFDGYGIGVIRGLLVEAGMPLPMAIIVTSLVSEAIDKTLTIALPMVVINLMSDRVLNKFVNGKKLRDLTSARNQDLPAPTLDQSIPAKEGGYGSYGDTE